MGLVKKLLIKPGYRLTVLNAPQGFALPADEMPETADVVPALEGQFDFVLLFVHNKAELEQHALHIISHLKEDASFWVAYPKKSSKIKTDISRDQGWEILHQAGYQGVSLISIDDTWSAFRVRNEKFIKKK